MAGLSTKAIKTRIKSMQSTRQITKAMELVAASKLRSAQAKAISSRPYFQTLYAAMDEIADTNNDFTSPYLHANPDGKPVYVVIAGDRGLAGGYNNNILKLVYSQMEDGAAVLPIGKKAVEYFRRKNVTVITESYAEAASVSIGISNEVSRKYGFSVIQPEGSGQHYAEWNAERSGKTTIRDLVRQDLDAAIAASFTFASLLDILRKRGYTVKYGSNVKYTAVKPPGGARFLRLDSLGEDYTEEAILQRLRRQRGVTAAIPPEQSESKRYTIRKRPRRYPPVKRGSFRALYLYYLYLLSPRKKRPQKIPFETRAEIRRAAQYRKQFFLLQKYHIDTKPELDMLLDALSNEMQIIIDQRKELYALRREQPSEQLDAEIDRLTAQLRPLRRELRLCGKIAEYAPRMLKQVQESNSTSIQNHAPEQARERRYRLWR